MSIYIYKDYNVEDILFDLPCPVMNCGDIYPIKIKDQKLFGKYTKYISFSAEHLGLENDSDLLKGIISLILRDMNGDIDIKTHQELVYSNLYKIFEELEELFSLVTRKQIKMNKEMTSNYVFASSDNSVVISDYNFNEVRKVILKQNLLHEPKIYKNKITQKWAEKVKKARLRNNPPTPLSEIINIVRNELKIPYSEILKLNILQLYVDYSRVCNTKEFDVITLFKTVSSEPKKLPKVNFNDSVIEKLYKNPDDTYFKEGSKLNDVMKEK